MQPKNEIKYGFLIKNGKIFDTKIQTYSLHRIELNNITVFRIKVDGYKRVIQYEYLLKTYSNYRVFDFLKNEEDLLKDRGKGANLNSKSLLNASNISIVYRYPPKYLNQKKFYLYKSCQALKKKLN